MGKVSGTFPYFFIKKNPAPTTGSKNMLKKGAVKKLLTSFFHIITDKNEKTMKK